MSWAAWGSDEDTLLSEMAGQRLTHTAMVLRLPGRTRKAIANRLSWLGLTRPRPAWAGPQFDAKVTRLLRTLSQRAVAIKLKVSVQTVRRARARENPDRGNHGRQ